MVTAIQVIEKTPMIVSADDTGIIKIWDIRTFKCFQTCDVGSKSVISKLLDIEGLGKICFISSRINFLEFDESFQKEDKKQIKEELYPLKVEFNYLSDELLVCTRKDLRFIDLEKGRIKKIYQGLLRNNDDDITIFKSVEQNKKFVIGDHRGGLNIFNFNSGEKSNSLYSHNNEISVLKVDFINKLFISSGYDSTIYIQKENKEVFEIKREIKNCFFGKEIHLMEVSVYHNLLVIGSNNRDIYIWDYEYCKLLGFLELDEGYEPTSLTFINGYSLLLVGASNNKIYFIQIVRKEQIAEFLLLGVINLEENMEKSEKTQNFQANKLLIDINFNIGAESPSECLLYLSLLKGVVKVYDILDIFELNKLLIIPNANKRMNYNAYRGVKEEFETALKKIKTNRYSLKEINFENFDAKMKLSFVAHKDSLTTLILINLAEKALLTSSLDHYVKIWTLKGEKLAAININHPLPILWNISLDRIKRTRKNILFALKIVELIFRRYKRSILLSEEKMININNFLAFLAGDLVKPKDKKKSNITLPSLKVPSKILLMRDEYSPRDLKFDNIKHLYQRELMGPSLREMENNKRLVKAQKFWKKESEKEEESMTLYEKNKLDEKIHKEKDPLAFFDNDFREKLCPRIQDEDYSDQVQKLSKRMELNLRRKKMNLPLSRDKSIDSDNNSKKHAGNKKNLDNKFYKKQTFIKNNNTEGNLEATNISKLTNNALRNSFPKHNSNHLNKSHYKKINLFDYANQKNLLLETTGHSIETFSSSTYSKPKNVEEKMQFHHIMKNIDKKLRTSQFNFTRNTQISTEASFSKTFNVNIKKKTNKKIPFDNNNTRGSLNTNDTIDDTELKMDEMITEIRNKVKDSVNKKLMIELEQNRKEREAELNFNLKRIISQKTYEDGSKEKQEQGFIGLGSVFKKVDWK